MVEATSGVEEEYEEQAGKDADVPVADCAWMEWISRRTWWNGRGEKLEVSL